MRQTETVVQSALAMREDELAAFAPHRPTRDPWRILAARWLNRDLPEGRSIELRISWPLWLIPIVLLNQLVAPHVVWVVFLVSLCGFYVVGYLWVRAQAPALDLVRRRVGSILVAGDLLQEEFELSNRSQLPLLWAEFVDFSSVPGYNVGRVVACDGDSFYRWHSEVLCERRGLFRLGPHLLRTQDPLGLFTVTILHRNDDIVVIYPRVVHLPEVQLPHGDSQGGDRQRRPIVGNLPAATVSDYQRGDSLRYVHWISSARRGRLMVKDLEIEPSGSIWIVLDLDQRVQRGAGQQGTLEHGIVVAASLAAELLSGRDHRAVGLLAYSGTPDTSGDGVLVEVMPGVGSARVWPILAALAPVEAGDLSLGGLLASTRDRIGRRSTLTVITPVAEMAEDGDRDLGNEASLDWVPELVHLKSVGVDCSVVLTAPADSDPRAGDAMQALLARLDIPSTVVVAGVPLPALLTFRRTRRVIRTTPTGGVVSYEVDEEVG